VRDSGSTPPRSRQHAPGSVAAPLPADPAREGDDRITFAESEIEHARLALDRRRREEATRCHSDGHAVTLRALPDYSALFGVDIDPTPRKASNE
jgi:hypothetical protein